MGRIKGISGAIGGVIGAATAAVAVKNAIDVQSGPKAAQKGVYEKYFKRPLDFFCAASATVVLSPVFAATSLLVRKKLGSPVIFAQDRPGKDGKIFKLYKFRSMTDEKGPDGALLSDEERLTPFGARLRATSLDELPELWNIVRGDMSFVGPRPLLVRYLPRYSEEQRHRHDVRPGLTGLAQVNGRNALSWEQKFAYDVEYVRNLSFALDVRIFFGTIAAVLRHEGISGEGTATMEEFMGNEESE